MFLYTINEYPLLQIYSRGKLEGRQRRMLLWYMSVERVSQQVILLPHNNLLLRETALKKLIIPNNRVGQGYDPFAPVDKKMSKLLTDWVNLDP